VQSSQSRKSTTVVESGDHLVVFCLPGAIKKIERMLVR
jgi:Trk K+ transport system NAD-binding subunit